MLGGGSKLYTQKNLVVQARCGACGDAVDKEERVIVLFSNADSSAYLGSTKPFVFPENIWIRYGYCATQNLVVHHDCAVIFLGECRLALAEALDRLWTIGCFKNPWHRVDPVRIPSDEPMSREAVAKVADIYALSQLASFPTELLIAIRHHAPSLLFWRCISALTLAAQLSIGAAQPARFVAATNIKKWERGGALELDEPAEISPTAAGGRSSPTSITSSSAQPVLRFTIDSQGIKTVEQLPNRPPYTSSRVSDLSFIVDEVPTFNKAQACLKNGLLQLQLPRGHPAVRIWHTPSPPPSLSQCALYSSNRKYCSWSHFHTIELDSIIGITFLYSHSGPVAIHTHRSSYDSAQAVADSIPDLATRTRMTWTYLPVSREDKILILGTRATDQGINFLVRKRLSGDVIIGVPSEHVPVAADRWRRKEPTTLIYGMSDDSVDMSFLGTYCRSTSTPASPTRHLRPQPDAPFATAAPSEPRQYPGTSFPNWTPLYSSAPLHGVFAAQVFHRPFRLATHRSARPSVKPDASLLGQDCAREAERIFPEICRGILLHYADGGARALGDVRVNVDASRTVVNPTRLCSLWFTGDADDAGGDELVIRSDTQVYESYPMRGELRVWYAYHEMRFAVVGES
ncbi:hypothetical protein B0T25DRAFT_569520 [Lasiosphaeria hispida]|uniref:Uncharacterized protein n=1 Tax=Lasiosphaeria hispida TaxID=260671 RepID=A0AAJ0HDG7_9PEZI|nr:hypothetical protein B0T25DRAFT_569520 [Lasiosphaeria hispida]